MIGDADEAETVCQRHKPLLIGFRHPIQSQAVRIIESQAISFNGFICEFIGFVYKPRAGSNLCVQLYRLILQGYGTE